MFDLTKYGPEDGAFFECLITVTKYQYDNDHYKQSAVDEEYVIQKTTLDRLYEEVAYFKAYREKPEDRFGGVTVEVSAIRYIVVQRIEEFSEAKLNETETWKQHIARLEKAEAEKKAKLEAEHKRNLELQEAKDRAEFERLSAKYGKS